MTFYSFLSWENMVCFVLGDSIEPEIMNNNSIYLKLPYTWPNKHIIYI